jgi:hypothetical protein
VNDCRHRAQDPIHDQAGNPIGFSLVDCEPARCIRDTYDQVAQRDLSYFSICLHWQNLLGCALTAARGMPQLFTNNWLPGMLLPSPLRIATPFRRTTAKKQPAAKRRDGERYGFAFAQHL